MVTASSSSKYVPPKSPCMDTLSRSAPINGDRLIDSGAIAKIVMAQICKRFCLPHHPATLMCGAVLSACLTENLGPTIPPRHPNRQIKICPCPDPLGKLFASCCTIFSYEWESLSLLGLSAIRKHIEFPVSGIGVRLRTIVGEANRMMPLSNVQTAFQNHRGCVGAVP